MESSRYQLMYKSVQPIGAEHLYHSKLEQFGRLALDIIHTKTEQVHVLFVASSGNHIKKLSEKYDRGEAQTCLVELWQADDTGSSSLLNMAYLKVSVSLYLGTDLALTRIPAQHCSRHVSQSSCLNAMDPYCGWNELVERCMPQPLDSSVWQHWHQAPQLTCPVLNAPIDGGWSAWSNWAVCQQHEQPDSNCQCRQRSCNNPQPQHGGSSCEGISTQVTNCTHHGGWTEWSAWSPCSQTCGIAVKIRRRSCGNPRPAHGGRTCVGSEQSEIYCRHLPPCPVPKPQSVDGGWGPWGEWSECSAQCGGGFRRRCRECNDPAPLNSGMECPGCRLDYEECNMQSCQEVRKLSAWTPWLTAAGSSNSSEPHLERRYRYACRATSPDASSARISLAKEESRSCHADGSCQRQGDHESTDTGDAADWSPCSVSCGGGTQHRQRGRGTQSRVCNLQACPTDDQQQLTGNAIDNELEPFYIRQYYDQRPKRQSSFRMPAKTSNLGNGNANGTLNRNNMHHNNTSKVLAKTYNDCETGTLKRQSALNNCRSNIADEKF